MNEEMVLSTLPKTWIFDLDGTLVKHNGYKTDGQDTLLPGVTDYLATIPAGDRVIILTSREEVFREQTITFLKEVGIRFDEIIFGVPMGERILINDKKPSGLEMAIAWNVERDVFEMPKIIRER